MRAGARTFTLPGVPSSRVLCARVGLHRPFPFGIWGSSIRDVKEGSERLIHHAPAAKSATTGAAPMCSLPYTPPDAWATRQRAG
jgi:hypothetical protein